MSLYFMILEPFLKKINKHIMSTRGYFVFNTRNWETPWSLRSLFKFNNEFSSVIFSAFCEICSVMHAWFQICMFIFLTGLITFTGRLGPVPPSPGSLAF